MGAASRHRRRCRAFQADSKSSTIASCDFDSDSEESDSSDDSDSRDDEGEEEEEENMASDYPQEDFDSEANGTAYKPCSP